MRNRSNITVNISSTCSIPTSEKDTSNMRFLPSMGSERVRILCLIISVMQTMPPLLYAYLSLLLNAVMQWSLVANSLLV